MSTQANTIRLNGKLYDTKTGAIFTHTPAHKPPKKHHSAPSPHAAKAVDGFILQHRPEQKAKHAATANHASKKPAKHAAKHTAAHRPQRTKTLMRSTVKPPAGHVPKPKNPDIKPMAALAVPAQIDSVRQARAQKISKSNLITRFGSLTPDSFVVKKSRHMPVKRAPSKTAVAPIAGHQSAPITAPAIAVPSAQEDIFTAAVNRAVSHKEAPPKGKKHTTRRGRRVGKRSLNIVVSSLIVLALVGFFAFQNLPNLQTRLASQRAGINASLPSYKPSGFSFAGVQHGPGEVTLGFSSNSDERQYTVTENASTWDSATLKDSYVAASGQQYQTRTENGKTVYLYGDSNATWVDGGIWYKVEGKSGLSSEQLLNIAKSL